MHNSLIIVILFVPLSLLMVQCGDSADEATVPERTVYFDILTLDLAEDDQFFMNRPGGIAQDSRGNLYVLDTGDRHILKFSPEGKFISYIGQPGEGPGEFQQPMAFTIDQDDNIYVLDFGLRRISIFDSDGEFVQASNYEYYSHVNSIAVNADGEIALLQPVLDGPLINLVNRDGEIIRSIGETTPVSTEWHPTPTQHVTSNMNQGRIRFNRHGDLFVAFSARPYIQKYTHTGELDYYRQLKGNEIDSLDQRRNEVINRIRREQGGLDPNLVIVTPYITGFDLLHDTHLLLGLRWNNYLYLIDDSGTVIEKIQCKAIEAADFELSGTGSFVITDNDRIIMIDPMNGLLWKGEL